MISHNKGLIFLCLFGFFGFTVSYIIAKSKKQAERLVIAKVIADKKAVEKFDVGSRDGAAKALQKISESLSGADKEACLQLVELIKRGNGASTSDIIKIAGPCNLGNLAKAYDNLKAQGLFTGNILGLEQMMKSKSNPYMAAYNAAEYIKKLRA